MHFKILIASFALAASLSAQPAPSPTTAGAKRPLTFDDMLAQVRQVSSMGSLEGMLDMIPGGGALKGQIAGQDTERQVKQMEAAASFRDLLDYVSFVDLWVNASAGLLPVRSFAFHLSAAAFFLYLTYLNLTARKWK